MLSLFQFTAILVTLAAVISWANLRTVRLPQNVALLLMGLFISLGVALLTWLSPEQRWSEALKEAVRQIDFSEAVLHGMLGFLLFSGALQVDLDRLRSRAPGILVLATVGVALTALIVGTGLWLVVNLCGIALSFQWAMVFGTLIAPTDPVAVLATLKSVSTPQSLETDMSGEALFNDGIAVVLFTVALMFAGPGSNPSYGELARLFALEAGGGIVLGLATGYTAYLALRAIDDYSIEVMISIALAMATYALADSLQMSGPIAVVVAGVLIGNRGASCAMSDVTRRYVFGFWRLVDDVLNAMLFLLVGLEVLVLDFNPYLGLVTALAIPLVLAARLVAVSGAVVALSRRVEFVKGAIPVLTWGGVRGGISVALALSVPDSDSRVIVLSSTYNVVLFTVLVQGLTLARVVGRLVKDRD